MERGRGGGEEKEGEGAHGKSPEDFRLQFYLI
jgi:hypothetical protein